MVFNGILFLLLLMCIILCAAAMCATASSAAQCLYQGGATSPKERSPHIVVDTLNLTHWLKHDVSADLIIATIDETAAILHKHHSGKVIYVVKDRESEYNSDKTRDLYQQAAIRNDVYICMAERYIDPPSGNKSTEHSSLGRDDFYMSILAYKHRCAVVTGDHLRDFMQFRSTIAPFHVIEYSSWRTMPQKEYIRPEASAFARIRRPWTILPAKYFAGMAS